MEKQYKNLMAQQKLSADVTADFYEKLENTESRIKKPRWRGALVAACLLLMVPLAAYAIGNIFGVSVVDIVKGNTNTGKLGTGYVVHYPDAISRPLSDFPKEIQTMEDYRLTCYDSWKQAEEELGITLINNAFLFDEKVTKERAYNLNKDGVPGRVHCYAYYNGLDNQFYRATITAAYRYDNMHITVRSTVTCEHPAISEQEAYNMHWHGVSYQDRDVEDIYQEQYFASNGINATIVTVDRTGGKTTNYEASFTANGASYRITIKAYDKRQEEEAKENLIKILESFVF